MAELVQEYTAQAQWRSWSTVVDLLESEVGALRGVRVADLGAGPGDQAVLLSRRGAEVTAVDRDPELLAAARLRAPELRLVCADLSGPVELEGAPLDGLWCGFSAAYFPAIGEALGRWSRWLRPGGWIAITEVDDLLGHTPLPAEDRAAIESFYAEARRRGTYEFCLRARLRAALSELGFRVRVEQEIEDQELAFSGQAPPEIEAAWRARFARMPGLRAFVGEACVRRLLDALCSAEHRSQAKVWTVIAER